MTGKRKWWYEAKAAFCRLFGYFMGKGSWAAGGAALLLGFAGSLFLYETASANPGKEIAAYRKALEAEEQKEYEKAIRMYQRCGDYAEAAGRLGQCRYRYGEALAGKKKYNAAIEMIRRSGYSDYREKVQQLYYRQGQQLMNATKFHRAVLAFQACRKAEGVEEQLLLAKYYCVQSDKTDKALRQKYLAELAALDYRDSRKILESQQEWSVLFTVNYSKKYDTKNEEILSRGKRIYFHFTIEGGDGRGVLCRYEAIWPDGSARAGVMEDYLYEGDKAFLWIDCDLPGNVTVNIFNDADYTLIGSKTVRLE